MPEKVFFTTTPYRWQPWEGPPYIQMVTELFKRRTQRDFCLSDGPADADIILFLEPNYFKDRSYAKMLLQQEMIRNYPNRCFVFNYDDVPIGFLPGVYVGIQRPHMDYKRFQSSSYLGEPNPFCVEASKRRQLEPKLLFSFRGANSAPVRDKLFKLGQELHSPSAVIQESFGWYNHTEKEQQLYLEEILNSKFVLCPRGIGVSSHRLFETMQLGRVPVILSDDWVPPEGPVWSHFSIRIAEGNLSLIPEILAEREREAQEMGVEARRAWEQWFSPEARVFTVLNSIREIKLRRDHDESHYQKEWLRSRFYRPYGLAPSQRLLTRLKTGKLLEPVQRRIGRLFEKLKH